MSMERMVDAFLRRQNWAVDAGIPVSKYYLISHCLNSMSWLAILIYQC